jgi:pimeloyl-ACP methyl ester carboxylesterase
VSELEFVNGANGNRLAVRTAGPVGAPAVVLLHGWAQSGRAWQRQLDGPLAGELRMLAPDLRGHGESEDAGGYRDGEQWAGDVAAVLATLERPAVLVGWSYGGLVIADYLRHHGTARVNGLLLAGAITEIGKGRAGGRVGKAMRAAMPDALSDDLSVSAPALVEFCRHMSVRPVPNGHVALGDAVRTPPNVRAELFAREVDSGEVLRSVDVPTVVVHGAADEVVDISAGHFAAERIPGAEFVELPYTGHMPFLERVEEFSTHLERLSLV